MARLSPRALREHVAAQLAEWRGLLAEPTQARAVLKALLDGGRFTFRPLKSGGCEITAALTYTSALARAGANSVVAPTGFEPVFTVRHALPQ